MKALGKLVLLAALLVVLLVPQTALAQGTIPGDKFVAGGTFTLKSGETLQGSLILLGGSATLEEGSLVTRDVLLAGGAITIAGKVEGDIIATGGLVTLHSSAVVQGNITTIGANLERDSGAQVEGKVNSGELGMIPIPLLRGIPATSININPNPILNVFWYFTRSFLWAALAVLVALFLPKQVEQTAQTALSQPLIAWGLGLLTVIILPLVLVVIALTLIGIPVSLLGFLALAIAWAFGLIALGTETGRRLAHVFNQDWALPVSAGLGVFVLTLVLNGLSALIACVGWLVPALVGMLGLGAVLLTRFGTQPYPLQAAPYPVIPPSAGPQPPAPTAPLSPPASPGAEPGAPSAEGETSGQQEG